MSGNVWMFSDQIDDEDVEFMTHDFVTYNMACDNHPPGADLQGGVKEREQIQVKIGQIGTVCP